MPLPRPTITTTSPDRTLGISFRAADRCIGRRLRKLKSSTAPADTDTVVRVLLRLHPFRRLAFVFIDTNVFRHALEERLKREHIVRGHLVSEDVPGTPPSHLR
jgi:hypothetical protein